MSAETSQVSAMSSVEVVIEQSPAHQDAPGAAQRAQRSMDDAASDADASMPADASATPSVAVTVQGPLGVDVYVLSGGEIRRQRQAVQMTQAELARRLNRSKSQLCAWEKGTYPVPFTVYQQFVEIMQEERRQRASYQDLLRTLDTWPTIGQL